jgi:hypothetical protein
MRCLFCVQASGLQHLTRLRTLRLDVADGDVYFALHCWLDGLPDAVQHVSIEGGLKDIEICSWPEPARTSMRLTTQVELPLEDAAGRLAGCASFLHCC